MATYGIDSKATKVAMILNPKRGEDTFPPDFYPHLNAWLIANAKIYAYALHDLDCTEEGEAKRHHIHIYAEMKTCRRMLTTLRALADWLDYDTNQISIERASENPCGFIQYLIHKNNPEKHQYLVSDIITNLNEGDLKVILESTAGDCSLTFFVSCARKARNKIEYIELIGFQNYHKFRFVLNDIWQEVKH